MTTSPTSPTQETEGEPRITDILRRMVELARETTKDPTVKAKDSQRKARIAMLMAMSALDTPDGRVEGVDLMIARRLAEEKERRRTEGVKAQSRAAWEKEKGRQQEEQRRDGADDRRMVVRSRGDYQRAECIKYQGSRSDGEGGSGAGQMAENVLKLALEEVRKAKEIAALAQEEVLRARQEAARERERAERAEEQRIRQAAKDIADRRSLEAQRESSAWARYDSQWKLLKRIAAINEDGCLFRFEDFPWPTVTPPTSPNMITTEEVSRFLASGPTLEEGQTIKSRIKDCLLIWHPDKFSGRWMRYVMESDRTRISEGIEAVTRAGRKVLDEYTSRART